ncbi:hypothetical protein DFP72DRAFT_929745 [Ephemerocybe angulata]|uniref:C2H2-type domain-containing protein n=1 Tax=Ephemerocybe angulata TaxID=980116 RepID=A0A8H6LX19_9AGAR|nr:hypothetical protein DFP72DRAFT_929745 [Tulosesus angulatus]
MRYKYTCVSLVPMRWANHTGNAARCNTILADHPKFTMQHTMDTMILAHRSCFSCQVSFLSADHYRLHAALRHGCPIPHKLKFREDKAAGKHRSAKRDMRTVPLDQGILLPPGIRPDGARGCSICGLRTLLILNHHLRSFFPRSTRRLESRKSP